MASPVVSLTCAFETLFNFSQDEDRGGDCNESVQRVNPTLQREFYFF